MPINSFLYPGAKIPTGFNVDNSLRFDSGSSTYLTKGSLGTGSTTKATFSAWIKKSKLSPSHDIYSLYLDNDNQLRLRLRDNGAITIYISLGNVVVLEKRSTLLLRDFSAWYHVCLVTDLTQSTSEDKYKIYINNEKITSYAVNTNTSATSYSNIVAGGGSYVMHIGSNGQHNDNFYSGYMAEVVHIDGQALNPTSFGEFDEDSPTIWKPIDVSGLTFGTNGFYLDFEDSSALGNDAGGSNNFTVGNLTAVDQSTDTCTNNFATLNPLYKQDHAFSEGNLGYTSSASDWDSAPSTFGASSGKWYIEMKVTGDASGITRSVLGLCDERDANLIAEAEFGITSSLVGDDVGYSNGAVHKGSSDQGGSFANYAVNDIIGMYADLDNGKVYFSKNGTMQNSGDPTSGSTGTGAISITTGQTYLFGATAYGGGASQMNFGSPPYAVSSGNTDPNGYGNFEYSTQNYYALNTKNLAEHG